MANLPDADAAGFKLFGKVIQAPDARRGADEGAPPPPAPAPPTVLLPPPPPPPPPPPLPLPLPPQPQPLPLPLQQQAPAGGAGGEPLPCPRCGSRETKFCYFNNYNVRQPRHLCRACRRYWTAGGALRRVVTGPPGRRRPRPNARSASAAAAASSASAAAEEVGGER